MEQKSIMQELREIPIGKHKDFPIKRMRTIQNYRTQLNQEFYQEGKIWEAVIIKEEGVIRATRVS